MTDYADLLGRKPATVDEGPHADAARGFLACVVSGRGELDTTRPPWSSTANALTRASNFNEGVREGQRLLRETTR